MRLPPQCHRSIHTQCLPSEATIAPGESKAVEVTFNPDHARIWSYEQAFQVVVPGQTEKQFLQVSSPCSELVHVILGLTCLSTPQVRGRSWRRQLYVHAAEPADDTEQRYETELLPWVDTWVG